MGQTRTIVFIIGLCFNTNMSKSKIELGTVFQILNNQPRGEDKTFGERNSQFLLLGELAKHRFRLILEELADPRISAEVWNRFLDKSLLKDLSKGIPADESFSTLFPQEPALSPRVIGNQFSRLYNLKLLTISDLAHSNRDTFRMLWTPQKGLTIGLRLLEELRHASRDLRQMPDDSDRTFPPTELEPFPTTESLNPGLVLFDRDQDNDQELNISAAIRTTSSS